MSHRILITSLKSVLPIKTPFVTAIRKIFFDTTSRKSFKDDKERQEFFESWTSFYIDHHPEDVLMAFNEKDQLMAYLTGCRDSEQAKEVLSTRTDSYTLFEDQFAEYPAHLHINTSLNFQGQGVGGALIQEYMSHLKEAKVKGLHIVTSGDSRNIGFYKKNGFTDEIERDFNGSRLRFMGIKF